LDLDLTRGGRAYLLPFVSGLLTVFAFPPFSIAPLAFVGLVPLLVWLDRPLTAKTLHRGGWAFAIPYIGGNLYWFYELGRVNLIGLAGATGIIILFWATFFIFPIVVNVTNHRYRLPLPLVAPLVWVVSECARGYGDFAFPAVTLGYALSGWPSLIQHADVVGVYGISWWIVLVNALLAGMITARNDRTRVRAYAACLLAAVALPAAYNTIRWRQVERELAGASTIRVAVIQPNVEQRMKWNLSAATEIFARINGMIAEAETDGPDLVVGPEASFPLVQSESATRLPDDITAGRRPLLIGSVTGVGEGVSHLVGPRTVTIYQRHYNSAVLAAADRSILGRHDKQYLVPVTERIPYQSVFEAALPFMRMQFGRFIPAGTLAVMELPVGDRRIPFGTLICYESVFPGLARRLRTMGALLLVNISNDSWFGDTSFPFQHVGFCAYRAIENRVCVVRSANTGISGVYDPLGRPTARTPIFTQTRFTASVPLVSIPTWYDRLGDLAMYASWAATGIFLALAWHGHRRIGRQ
jgi:apolipoprotein N-acyltransferase